MAKQSMAGAVVVITGASSGIGQATAEAFARKGAKLVLAARNEEALEQVAENCRIIGAPAIAVPTDVTDAQAVLRLAERAKSYGDRIDVWVSNVGVGAVGAFHEVPVEAHDKVIRAGLIGHMNDAHAVLPIFIAQERGTFINMISLGGFASIPFAASYSAAKFGLKGFSEALRGELLAWPRIQVCDIYPSFVDTPALSHSANYTGKALTAPPPVLDARRVARAIVSVAERPRVTKMVGSPTPLIRFGHFLAPETSARIASGILKRYFARAEPAARGDGNLFAPPARIEGIDGGLRSPEQRATVMAAGLSLAAGLGIMVLLMGAARGRGQPQRRRRRRFR